MTITPVKVLVIFAKQGCDYAYGYVVCLILELVLKPWRGCRVQFIQKILRLRIFC